jgi:hypothetical protein
LALWLDKGNVRMKVAQGVIAKQRSGEALDVVVKPGFDWQPYRLFLLVVGAVVAIAIIFSLCLYIIFTSRIFKHAPRAAGGAN